MSSRVLNIHDATFVIDSTLVTGWEGTAGVHYHTPYSGGEWYWIVGAAAGSWGWEAWPLAAGTYTIELWWYAGLWYAGSAARFDIVEGETTLATVAVDQTGTIAAAASALGTVPETDADGYTYCPIATVTTSGGLVSIVGVGSDDAGAIVVLDRVRITSSGSIDIPWPVGCDRTGGRVCVGPEGKTILFAPADDAGIRATVTSVTVNPSIAIDGGSSASLANPVFAGMECVIYKLPSAVTSSNVVAATAPGGWMTNDIGGCGPLASFIAEHATHSYCSRPIMSNGMRIGKNVAVDGIYQVLPVDVDAMKRSSPWIGDVAVNASGLPTRVNSGYSTYAILAFGGSPPGDPAITRACLPSGTYTIEFTNPTLDLSVKLIPMDGATVITNLGRAVINSTTGEVRVTQSVSSPMGGIAVAVSISQPTAGPVSDPWGTVGRNPSFDIHLGSIAAYLPGVNPTAPGRFSTNLISALDNAKILRFLDATAANGCGIFDRSGFTPDSQLSHSTPCNTSPYTIAQILTYSNSDNAFNPDQAGTFVQFDLTAPHGLVAPLDAWDGPEGFIGSVSGFLGPNGDGTVPITGGSYLSGPGTPPDGLTSISGAWPMHVVGPTTLAAFMGGTSGVGARIIGSSGTPVTYGGGGATIAINGDHYGFPLNYMVDLCNAAVADCWWNMPIAFRRAEIHPTVTQIMTRLDPGRKLHLEGANELWNYALGFQQNWTIQNRAHAAGQSFVAWVVSWLILVFAEARRAAADLGRSADLVCILGAQSANAGYTDPLLAEARSQGLIFDRLAVAGYYNACAAGSDESWAGYETICDSLDHDQKIAYSDAWAEYSGDVNVGVYALNRSILNKYGFDQIPMCVYEANPTYGALATASTDAAVISAQSRAWARDPRMRWINLKRLGDADVAGVKDYCEYMAYGIENMISVGWDADWADRVSCVMRAGPGDGTGPGGVVNATVGFDNVNAIESPLGQSVLDFAALSLVAPRRWAPWRGRLRRISGQKEG